MRGDGVCSDVAACDAFAQLDCGTSTQGQANECAVVAGCVVRAVAANDDSVSAGAVDGDGTSICHANDVVAGAGVDGDGTTGGVDVVATVAGGDAEDACGGVDLVLAVADGDDAGVALGDTGFANVGQEGFDAVVAVACSDGVGV